MVPHRDDLPGGLECTGCKPTQAAVDVSGFSDTHKLVVAMVEADGGKVPLVACVRCAAFSSKKPQKLRQAC
eukprot:7527500-Prorocentrum_lima.AAC.1